MKKVRVLVTAATVACAVTASGVALTQAALTQDTYGKSTLEQRIGPATLDAGFRQLALTPSSGEPYVVREDGVGAAKSGREARRKSLAYFGQLSDFQLADEESPARVEFLDTVSSQFSAAFRPGEALEPQIDDAMIRQMNSFINAAPVAAAGGVRPKMTYAIDTGDSADSQQLNETQWVRELLEGGPLDPNSGVDPATPGATTGPNGAPNLLCGPSVIGSVPGAAEAATYTGVQDTDDTGMASNYYDPDLPTQPAGRYSTFPQITDLMNRAQAPFTAAGLDVPSYVAFGNHDGLVQGNVAATSTFETVATGCIKPLSATFPGGANFLNFTPQDVLNLFTTDPSKTILVPPDPERRYVSKQQFKQVMKSGAQADGHGFGLIDPAVDSASKGSAGYYTFSPEPGIRMIALDTISEGGAIGASADGNVDDPQFKWLEDQLQKATASDELVILFSHHAINSLTADVPDEIAPACTSDDVHTHDMNPGCDVDPRASTPIHLGDDMTALLHRYPHVIAWVAGHSHVNRVEPYPDGKGGGFWQVRVAAEADWPQQARLLQLFDNDDGTLSLFGTIIDHASNAAAPVGAATAFDTNDLASVGRTLSYNDPDAGARACGTTPCGEGLAVDRNVELLISDPRKTSGGGGTVKPGRCVNRRIGTSKRDFLRGTRSGDRLNGLGGDDRLLAFAGVDCIAAGGGGDVASGGSGNDRISGGPGADRLIGGPGKDRLHSGQGDDRVGARDGAHDAIRCGRGRRDVAIVDRKDSVRGCEIVRRAPARSRGRR